MGRTGLRILIVESDREQGNLLAAALSVDGHQVSVATSGGSSIELALREVPDAVVLTIGLPDVNGYEIARQLRAGRLPDASVIVAVTASGEEAPREVTSLIDLQLSRPIDYDLVSGLLHFLHEKRRHRPLAAPTPSSIGSVEGRRRR